MLEEERRLIETRLMLVESILGEDSMSKIEDDLEGSHIKIGMHGSMISSN